MANLVRVTGTVGLVDVAHIVSKKDGQQYTFHTASVMVAGSGVSELRFDPERNGRTFATGDVVDVLAQADVYGNRPTLDYRTDYPRSLREAEADALLASSVDA